MSTNVEGQFVSPNDAKPNVIRRLSSRELLTDFVQSMQCNMINCGELSIKEGVEQYIESINGMLPDGV